MQIRMIFATLLPPPAGEMDPIELKVGTVATVEDEIGAALVEEGRAEPFKPAAAPAKA